MEITNFLKGLKNIGNDAAHSSNMIYNNDDKNDVMRLFKGINIVFNRLVSEKREIEEVTTKYVTNHKK